MPLRALLDKEPFLAWELTEKHRGSPFKCPICDDDMIIVLPQSGIIKHFRHVNEEAHGEPETSEHLEMKNFIYNLLLCTELEKKIGHRIADVVEGDQLVIECQCSPISQCEMREREEDYNECGYHVLWVFGGKYYQNTTKRELWYRGGNAYYIQKIGAPERYLLDNESQLLIYYHNEHFYLGSFKFRKAGWYNECKTLGWYQLRRYNSEYFERWVQKNLYGRSWWNYDGVEDN